MQGAPEPTLGVHLDPPPLQVVRGGQGLGAGPDGPPHHPPRRPVDEGLPGDDGLLLCHQCQQLALEGHLGRLLLSLLPIGLTNFGLGSFKHLWLLDQGRPNNGFNSIKAIVRPTLVANFTKFFRFLFMGSK